MTVNDCVGIDLGTTNSSLAVVRGEQLELATFPPDDSELLPSRVGFDPEGNFYVGPATRNYEHDSTLVAKEFKRELGTGKTYRLRHGEFDPVELSAFVLQRLKQQAEEGLGIAAERAVISVPASFNEDQREATVKAARAADIEVVRLINEPTAAALEMWSEAMQSSGKSVLHKAVDGASNLLKGFTGQRMVVVDLGGGTLDVSVVDIRQDEQEVLASEGSADLGGKDFDEVLAGLICEQNSLHYGDLPGKSRQWIAREAEKCKMQLDDRGEAGYHMPGVEVSGGRRKDLSGELTRRQFENSCQRLLDRAERTVRRSLDAAGIGPEDIKQIALVGGGTLTPCVQDRVGEIFGREVSPLEHAQTAVVRGAAHSAADVGDAGGGRGPTTTEVCPRTLGIGIITRENGRLVSRVDPLIEKNTRVPAEQTREYTMLEEDNDRLILEVYECPRTASGNGFERDPERCNQIQRRVMTGIPPSSFGDKHSIEVSFRYDSDGRVRVSAEVAGRSEDIEFRDTLDSGSDADVDSMRDKVEDLTDSASETREKEAVELSIDHLDRPTLKRLLEKAEGQSETASQRSSLREIKQRLKNSRNLSERELDEIEDELADLILEL